MYSRLIIKVLLFFTINIVYGQGYTCYSINSVGSYDTLCMSSKSYIVVLGEYNCTGCVKSLMKLFNDSFKTLKDSLKYGFAFEKLKEDVQKRIYAYNLANQFLIESYFYINDSFTVKFPYFLIQEKEHITKIGYEDIFEGMFIKEEFIKLVRKNL